MTVNEAVEIVITTQFKKEMGEALEIIKEAGFVARKIDGGWEVFNPETGREVWVSLNRRNWTTRLRYGTYNNKSLEITTNYALKRFDFEGNLRKPLNKEYEKVLEMRRNWKSATRKKYEKLHDAKWSVEWRKKDIENIKKKMEELQKDLEQAIRWEIEEEQRLKETRRELNLKR